MPVDIFSGVGRVLPVDEDCDLRIGKAEPVYVALRGRARAGRHRLSQIGEPGNVHEPPSEAADAGERRQFAFEHFEIVVVHRGGLASFL